MSKASPPASALVCHLIGLGSWFFANGLQFILVPTVALVVLGAGASELGIAQLSLLAPSILLMAIAGVVADRRDERGMLAVLHFLASLPPMWLAYEIWRGSVSYTDLIIFALCMGVCSAFIMPTRDSLLTRVTSDVPRGVLSSMLTQFGAQLLGFVCAGGLALTAPVWSLVIAQGIIVLGGTISFFLMPPLAAKPPPSKEGGWTALREGWRGLRQSPRLLPVWGIASAVGVFYIGAFLVCLPILTTAQFGGGQWELSLTNFAFWSGTIITTMVLMARKPIKRRGRAMVLALTYGAGVLALISISQSFWMLCLLCVLWGCGGGLTMTMSRTMMQTKAPERLRARILAFYNLGMIGAAPIGAFFLGFATDAVGARASLMIPVVGMLLFLLFLLWRSRIWYIR